MNLQDMTEKHSFSNWTMNREPELIHHLLDVKMACAQANEKAAVIEPGIAEKIVLACKKLQREITEDNFPVDLLQGGGGIAIHLNLNHAICQGDEDLSHESVNASQSTVDVVSTGLRLSLILPCRQLDENILETITELRKLGERFSKLETLSRTCLRDALPTVLGDKFENFADQLFRRRKNFEIACQTLTQVSLGGTLIGRGDGASEEYRSQVVEELATITGQNVQRRIPFKDASQNIDDLVEISHSLALLAESCIKMAKDLRLLHSGPQGGFGEITLPQVMPGSSFFADKNNPTVVETLIQACFEVLGNHRSTTACLEHGELEVNTFEAMAGLKTLDSVRKFSKALQNFRRHALNGLEANKERCHELKKLAAPTRRETHGT